MSRLRTLGMVLATVMREPRALKRVLSQERPPDPPTHDQTYGDDYFRFVEQTTAQSADTIAGSLVDAFNPRSVVDVGCGTGVVIDRLRARGVTVRGLEFATAALQACWRRDLDVVRFDVTTDRLPNAFIDADVALSLEVGQQVPDASATRYVDLLCRVAPLVVFSSATPGQGDRRPVNEQPHQYWIEKFAERGYRVDAALSRQWRAEWQARQTAPWFYRNVLVLRRDGEPAGASAAATGTTHDDRSNGTGD